MARTVSKSKAETEQRKALAQRLRDEGKTFTEIGVTLGITRQAAFVLLNYKSKRKRWTCARCGCKLVNPSKNQRYCKDHSTSKR